MKVGEDKHLDMFGLFQILRAEFKDSFPQRNIQAGYRRSVMRPLNPEVIINVPRLATNRSNDEDLLGTEELRAMLRVKAAEVR